MSQEKQSKNAASSEEKNKRAATDISEAGADSLEADTSQQEKSKKKSAFEVYCDENPDASECRIYEDQSRNGNTVKINMILKTYQEIDCGYSDASSDKRQQILSKSVMAELRLI